jgi:membrane fusion protein, copper/silver efflux system
MNRNCIGNLWLVWLLLAVALGCDSETETAHEHPTSYTCPMHPQIVRDEPGSCPICGMDLVPMATGDDVPIDSTLRPLLKATNVRVISDIPTLVPQTGTRIVTLSVQGKVAYDTRQQVSVSSRVAGRIERVGIRYNFQPVRKGQLLMEIYSPELAAAQRELIYIHQQDNNPALRQGVRQKLQLLGMSTAQIEKVIKTGKPLYRVPVYSPASGYIVDQSVLTAPATEPFTASTGGTSGGAGMSGMGGAPSASSAPAPQAAKNTAVLIREGQYVNAGEAIFTIYKASSLVADFYLDPTLSREVKRGQKILYTSTTGAADLQPGTIGLIEPVQRGGESFAVARMYLRNSALHPGQLLTAEIPVVKEKGAWLPQSAVVGLGTNSVIFRKEGGVFKPKHVQTGLRAEGVVHILDDITGWQVAKSASYLVDSESFIRAPADF